MELYGTNMYRDLYISQMMKNIYVQIIIDVNKMFDNR